MTLQIHSYFNVCFLVCLYYICISHSHFSTILLVKVNNRYERKKLHQLFIYTFLPSFLPLVEHACLSSPCMNGATCVEDQTGFSCICSEGWTGHTCTDGDCRCCSHSCLTELRGRGAVRLSVVGYYWIKASE